MQEEMNSLTKNDVYKVTKLPSNKQCIDGRWVFTVKYDECGEVKHKARFVAKGFNQRYGIDYEETFAPTAQISSVRMLCQAAVDQNLDIYQMDVKSAYLNATIDKEIFVKTPKGFSEKDDNGDDLVWKLKKSLYDLKQSGRIWNECINDSFLSMGFQRSQADACIYIKSSDQGKVIVLVWVDDILIASNSQDLLNDVKSSLCSKYDMKDLGKINSFLGIDFTVGEGEISMSQDKYCEKLLSKFHMSECKPRSFPCSTDLDKNCDNSPPFKNVKVYQELIGSLIYLMTSSRPDISYVVTRLSQKMSSPSELDWAVAKGVLRYLKGTLQYKLVFKRCERTPQIIAYKDADWAGAFR